MEMGFIDSGSSSPPNPSSFLKFGRKVYFEDAARSTSSTPRRVRASGGGSPNQGGAQPPRCQVEECNVDLTNAKAYYSKHKVCGTHSKTSQVIVGGIKQRFCQQCSRFHQLSEFDQGKRSCRRRLAGHNERRRKPPPGSLFSPHFGRLPSSIFEKRTRSGGFIMDFTRDSWPSAQSNRSTSSKNPPPLLQTSSGTAISSPVECYTGGESTNSSSCALSLLSNQPQLLGSRPNHDMNHPFHGVSLPCVFKGGDVSPEIVPPDLGFQDPGQFLQTLDGHHFSEEVDDLPQQGRRQYYMEEELHYSRSFGSSHHHQMEYRPL